MGRLACLAVAAMLLYAPPARADDERSVGWAYAISTTAVLVPMWSATAIMPNDERPFAWSPRTIAGASLAYTSLVWGPSAGYLYSGNHRYALVGGLGRTGLLAAGYGAHRLLDPEGGHPYVMGLTVMAVTLWGFGDFLFLRRDVHRQNERRHAASTAMISIGGHF
jgi:hypothetical protein